LSKEIRNKKGIIEEKEVKNVINLNQKIAEQEEKI